MAKIFLDTSCLIASLHAQNDKHRSCFDLVRSVVSKQNQGGIAMHSLAEFFSVVTRLPGKLRVAPSQAITLIHKTIIPYFEIIEPNMKDYLSVLDTLSEANLGGGLIYDAIILKCAEKGDYNKIYTLNLNHFRAIPSAVAHRICEP